jgi:hypothetical protein
MALERGSGDRALLAAMKLAARTLIAPCYLYPLGFMTVKRNVCVSD